MTGIVRLNEDDRPRRDVRQVRLRFLGFDRVGAFGVGLGVTRAALDEGPDDRLRRPGCATGGDSLRNA